MVTPFIDSGCGCSHRLIGWPNKTCGRRSTFSHRRFGYGRGATRCLADDFCTQYWLSQLGAVFHARLTARGVRDPAIAALPGARGWLENTVYTNCAPGKGFRAVTPAATVAVFSLAAPSLTSA